MFTPDTSISEFIPLSSHVATSVVKTTGGDYLLTWHLEGLPFVGREEWELEHRHNTFNRLLQTLRAPDFVNVAFWVHDIRRRRQVKGRPSFRQCFNQELSDNYMEMLSSQRIMQNELYLTMIYRPVVAGKRLVEKSADIARLQAGQEQAVEKLLELAGNVEAVIRDYAPYRLGMYEARNGVVFSETLEFLGYLLNRVAEPVPVPAALHQNLTHHVEGDAEQRHLRQMRLVHVHELRNEGAEEHQHFRVRQQHQKALQEEAAARRRRLVVGADALDRRTDQLDAEPDQVGAADPLERQQRGGRGLEQGAEAEHGQGDQGAEADHAAKDGGQRHARAVQPAVGQRQQAVGAGRQRQAEGGDEVDEPEFEGHAGNASQLSIDAANG